MEQRGLGFQISTRNRSRSTSEAMHLPAEPKRLRRTRKTMHRGAEVLPLLSLITSSQPPRSHGNIITMVTHHSNPIAVLKGIRNANTQFTFLTAPIQYIGLNESPELCCSYCSQLERWHVVGKTSGGPLLFRWNEMQLCCDYFRLSIMVEMKTKEIRAFVLNVFLYILYGSRLFLKCLPQISKYIYLHI